MTSRAVTDANRSMIVVRPEDPADVARVRSLTRQAFETSPLGYGGEAELIDVIRREHLADIVSLVAEQDDRILGHILLSPVVIAGGARTIEGMGLGPMTVEPH
jgi:putative acetyltransferase